MPLNDTPQGETTQTEVTIPVKGVTTISLASPTPKWAVYIVRGLTWLTGAWVGLGFTGVLEVWGIPADLIHKMDVTMPVVAAGASVVARFLGVKSEDSK